MATSHKSIWEGVAQGRPSINQSGERVTKQLTSQGERVV